MGRAIDHIQNPHAWQGQASSAIDVADEAEQALDGFHPAIRQWFEERFERPTLVQERGWRAIRSGEHTLIAAPTGSGKTLSAFLNALDSLLHEGAARGGKLPDETRVLYVSPLKALSADIHRNLAEPRREIRRVAQEMGVDAPRITAAVRSGDTPSSERQAMVRTPPHILVTTPESLYLLLTAEKSRTMLRTVRTVIIDEIHAVLESRRGSHLALTLERLQHVAGGSLQRVGLSATQKPVEDVARFLVSASNTDADGHPHCRIVDEGHVRELDLEIELPGSPLEAVLSAEVREEIYERVAELVTQHTTTLVFVNTRREAERGAHRLAELLGNEAVTAHHGSLSKEARLKAERRLKTGDLKALVATASMELGIDIGHVDLVCQVGSPRRIATLLQRVGRSGHTVYGTPKGRLFPLTRDELVEAAALLRSVRRGELDRLEILEEPIDILAQQIIAEVACEEWDEDRLYDLLRRAHPYRNLTADRFHEVVEMVGLGFTTREGRRGARIHYDAINRKLRARRGSRLAALTSGGAIPDNADYRVVLEPEGTFVGTVDEDFAIESFPGDIFQLGSTSWRILRVESGTVRVADAAGEPPTIPFWFGEAPSRSPELSSAVSELRGEIEVRLDAEDALSRSDVEEPRGADEAGVSHVGSDERLGEEETAILWLILQTGIPEAAAIQVRDYLADTYRLLGALPTQETLILERFFDEAGGMQLVLHSPFGSRVNRAWGLALRKRFCRQFNFELQAAATEEGILLSLGPQHSFPLEDVFRYLHPDTVEDILVQALLDAPMFQTHWRWNASLSLALLRWSGGRKVAPQIQRMRAEDLLVAVFPDAAACLETIVGDREVPDHPLVQQTIHDCLTDVMDLPRLKTCLQRIHDGEFRLVARDTPEPSPLSHELLTARPYAFLDDAPLEERRASAVYARRTLEPSDAGDLGALDRAAIERVRREARPIFENADELHDALLTFGFLTDAEIEEIAGEQVDSDGDAEGRGPETELMPDVREPEEERMPDVRNPGGRSAWEEWTARLAAEGRAAQLGVRWIAAERLPEARLLWPDDAVDPDLRPDSLFDEHVARREMMRARLTMHGPATVDALVDKFSLRKDRIAQSLLALEGEGVVLRGRFTPGVDEEEWCDRRLLARIHRYTIDRMRAQIRPVSQSDYMKFLIRWQRAEPGHRVQGPEGLMSVVEQLEGVEVPGVAWDTEVLPARCEDYAPDDLDALCTSGRIMWGRLSAPSGNGDGLKTTGPLRTSPIALWPREHASFWMQHAADPANLNLSTYAQSVYDALERHGASFFQDLTKAAHLLPTQVEQGLGELVAFGLVTSDSFSGLRALLTPVDQRNDPSRTRRRGKTAPYGMQSAGRWSLLKPPGRSTLTSADDSATDRAAPSYDGQPSGPNRSPGSSERTGRDGSHSAATSQEDIETWARILLRRYGVVFRKLLAREPFAPPWRDLLRMLWRMEARGEVRGGRFVSGFSGEQFALAEAVAMLRKMRRDLSNDLIVVSAADPLNLTGVATPGSRIAAYATNRVAFRDGVPELALEGGDVRSLRNGEDVSHELKKTMRRRHLPPELHVFLK